jgi:hypothetical protein
MWVGMFIGAIEMSPSLFLFLYTLSRAEYGINGDIEHVRKLVRIVLMVAFTASSSPLIKLLLFCFVSISDSFSSSELRTPC